MPKNGRSSLLDDKARATRRKILVEATRLFARQGYHKTTVTDIANAIGMTQGALFHHFANKEALLAAVVRRLARGFAEYRAAMDPDSVQATLERVIAAMVEHYEAQPEATLCLAALATEFGGSDHPILAEIRAAYDCFVEPFEELLSHYPGVENPREVAIAYIGAMQGIGTQGMLREGNPPLRDLAFAFQAILHVPD
jgi:AcrR family transcriptional regulator